MVNNSCRRVPRLAGESAVEWVSAITSMDTGAEQLGPLEQRKGRSDRPAASRPPKKRLESGGAIGVSKTRIALKVA